MPNEQVPFSASAMNWMPVVSDLLACRAFDFQAVRTSGQRDDANRSCICCQDSRKIFESLKEHLLLLSQKVGVSWCSTVKISYPLA
jgi:hypothetical protein